MGSSPAPIHFGRSSLGKERHACAFFNSEDDENATLLPFLCDGLKRGERAVHVHSPARQEYHRHELRKCGVDVHGVLKTGQLEYATPDEAYLSTGRFDADVVLKMVEKTLRRGYDMGFPLTRLVAHPEAIFHNSASKDDWIEYEARLNDLLDGFDDPVICAYDVRLLDGETVLAILRTHPVAIVNGVLRHNPFYSTPLQVIHEIHERRTLSEAAG